MTEAFEREVIDRLARIETKQDDATKRLDGIDARLCKGDEKMDGFDRVAQAVNDKDTGLAATRKKVDNLNLKAVAIGAAVGVAGYFGLDKVGWLGGLLNK